MCLYIQCRFIFNGLIAFSQLHLKVAHTIIRGKISFSIILGLSHFFARLNRRVCWWRFRLYGIWNDISVRYKSIWGGVRHWSPHEGRCSSRFRVSFHGYGYKVFVSMMSSCLSCFVFLCVAFFSTCLGHKLGSYYFNHVRNVGTFVGRYWKYIIISSKMSLWSSKCGRM